MNVNIHDLERTEKNLANKKAKPSYNPYDMEEDEYGMVFRIFLLAYTFSYSAYTFSYYTKILNSA